MYQYYIYQYSYFREVGADSSYVHLFCILFPNSCNFFLWAITYSQKYHLMHWKWMCAYWMFTIYAKKIKCVLIENCLPQSRWWRWWLLLANQFWICCRSCLYGMCQMYWNMFEPLCLKTFQSVQGVVLKSDQWASPHVSHYWPMDLQQDYSVAWTPFSSRDCIMFGT